MKTFHYRARELVLATATAAYDPGLVHIDYDRVQAVDLPKGELTPMKAGLVGTARGSTLASAIAYLVLLNSINYRFWHARLTGLVRYAYDGAVGAMGMRKAFSRAWGDQSGPEALRAALAAPHGITDVFGDIPDPEGRAAIFRELLAHDGAELRRFAEILADKIEATGELTVDDAERLQVFFPRVHRDPLLKKAQLTLCEIAGHCRELGLPMQEKLTVFADYQVPRILRALGVLVYSPALAERVDTLEILPEGGRDEWAIRAATILAGEALAERFGVDASMVDNYLWTQRNSAGAAPFHLTLTEAY